jgi:Flp pilus assembly protein CpaB
MPRRPAPGDAEQLGAADVSNRPAIRRRTPLPNGRAVAGGFLVAVAALGVAAAHLEAGATADHAYVVAAAPITPGAVLDADDLDLAVVDLPPAVATHAFRDLTEVEGAVALGPLAPGELIQATGLLPGDEGRPPQQEVSVSVERDQAVGGSLVSGDVVDLLATYGTGDAAFTQTVARGVTVRSAATDGDGGGFAGSGLVTVTLALDGADLLAVAHAAHADALTIVRSTGTDEAPGPDDVYRPTAPDEPEAPLDGQAETETETEPGTGGA